MLNLGIVGTGAIATDFCTALAASTHCRAVSVVASTPDKAAAFAARHGLPRAAGTLADLLADPDVDAVYIATPHGLHVEQAQAAITAGRHVLCEKPLTLDAADTAALFAQAAARGVRLMEAFMYRCHPLIDALIAVLRGGRIGRLQHIRADFGFRAPFDPAHRLFDPALGGGAILDVGGYPMSFARLIAGVAVDAPFAEPVDLQALGQRGPTGVDELSTALLRFQSGISAEIACAIRHPLGSAAVLFGDEGRLRIPEPWLPGGQRQGLISGYTIERDGCAAETVIIESDRPVYALEADRFAEAVIDGRIAWPAMTAEDSIGNARALDRWRG